MKKFLVITLIDGWQIKRDITLERGFPLGAKANDQTYAMLCQTIAMNGYTDVDKTNEEQYVHIAPSQISRVAVEFINQENEKEKTV